jgi:hypothetical protein
MEGRYYRSSGSVSPNKYASDVDIHSTRNMFAGILDLLHSCGPGSGGEVNSSQAPWTEILMMALRSTFTTGALVPSLLGRLTAILVLPLFIFAKDPVLEPISILLSPSPHSLGAWRHCRDAFSTSDLRHSEGPWQVCC